MRIITMLLAALLIAVLTSWNVGWRPALYLSTRWNPGILAPVEPTQRAVPQKKTWQIGKSSLTALATFDAEVRVLFTTEYPESHDNFRLSPIDLVVGWGPMSDSAIIDQVRFGHGYRKVTFMPSPDLGISSQKISSSLSHIHAIPASSAVDETLKGLNTDDIVSLRGYLVVVESPTMLPWTSSLTRDDSGCEIMYIEEAAVTARPPSFFDYIGTRLLG